MGPDIRIGSPLKAIDTLLHRANTRDQRRNLSIKKKTTNIYLFLYKYIDIFRWALLLFPSVIRLTSERLSVRLPANRDCRLLPSDEKEEEEKTCRV